MRDENLVCTALINCDTHAFLLYLRFILHCMSVNRLNERTYGTGNNPNKYQMFHMTQLYKPG